MFREGYRVIVADGDRVATTYRRLGQWPLIIVTSPAGTDSFLRGQYETSPEPVRAVVFHNRPVSRVEYCIDNMQPWHPLAKVGDNVWQSKSPVELPRGVHYVVVRAMPSRPQMSRWIRCVVTTK